MLYLEDYLEMIEQLPDELRDRFTEIRELDLQVQNSMDSLEERVKAFFTNCKKNPTMEQKAKDEQFDKIKQDYYKALEDADDKIQLSTQVYDLVDRHLRKLDQELSKFKMELEADNAGITEYLERRSLELDKPPQPVNNHRPEKRKYVMSNHVEAKRATAEKSFSSLSNELLRDPTVMKTGVPSSGLVSPGPSSQPAISYSLGQIGSGSNAIATAASAAIAATQQMSQGRRTASLKASYEAMRNSDLKNLSVGRETLITAAAAAAVASGSGPAVAETPRSARSSKKQKASSVASLLQAQQVATTPTEETYQEEEGANAGASSETTDWQYDPNEPRYCICNQVSYGDMVGCDNESCPFEWFHYDCVGITQPPKGKWYCPSCSAAMKRRGQKQEKKGDKDKSDK
ncbi:PREDICTED: inhibitor of growth protein 3-like [Priapulus caudatus]|uniref:Inhibitor of growth protein n=1 Tax=Priapulus caudatus TaxID=37621 RepID=A0ABM1EBG7_PRICU|nr:PREDICTED: inhibitor of growth protein 3-like [Priapulus caudatus]